LQIETKRRRKMRRVLYIFACLLAIGAVQAVPAPDNVLPQRVETAVTGPAAQGAEGRIVFTAGNSDAVFNVYSITGQLIKVVRVGADQRVSLDFPKGFYIVRCGNQWSRKVVVR
jgi:hypothetical protein